MGWSPAHGRIREKYNPVMNVAEKRHKARVQREPCFGCGSPFVQAHHTLLKFPEKRWRRDHMCLLPVCAACHALIHDHFGCEELWLDSIGIETDEAIGYILRLRAESEAA